MVSLSQYFAESPPPNETHATERFFTDIFGDAISPSRRLAIFSVPALRTELFATAADAAQYAVSQAAGQDIYFGLGLIAGSPTGRGRLDDIAAVGCLWADIDLAGPAHSNGKLPASVEQARAILARVPLRPSLIIDSGHGLHAHWLFKEVWAFDSPAERERAARLAKGWHAAVCAAAESLSWRLENLGDLTRVLRPPGTISRCKRTCSTAGWARWSTTSPSQLRRRWNCRRCSAWRRWRA